MGNVPGSHHPDPGGAGSGRSTNSTGIVVQLGGVVGGVVGV